MLILKLLAKLLAQMVKTQRVELVRVGIQFWVPVDGVADDHDQCFVQNNLVDGKLETTWVGDDIRNTD